MATKTGDRADPSPTADLDALYRAVEVLGDAWSWLVMRETVLYDVRRFTQLQERLGVARSTLTARLRQLIDGGLLAEHPGDSGNEYVPTERGHDMLAGLLAAMRWGDRWYFDEHTRPVVVTHIGRGHSVQAVLTCAACGEVVTATEVEAERPGPFGETSRLQVRRRTPDLSLLERVRTCSIARTLNVTGDYWSSLLIREAFFGTRRFDDFQRNLDIAPNILSARLRRLVELGILDKVQYSQWPVRHEYRLTERGLGLYPLPLAVLAWGQRWLPGDKSDIRLTHKPCGNKLVPVLTCDECGDPITRDEIELQLPDPQQVRQLQTS
jgi:DNA-binding HxlR family transcriptional regulator